MYLNDTNFISCLITFPNNRILKTLQAYPSYNLRHSEFTYSRSWIRLWLKVHMYTMLHNDFANSCLIIFKVQDILNPLTLGLGFRLYLEVHMYAMPLFLFLIFNI